MPIITSPYNLLQFQYTFAKLEQVSELRPLKKKKYFFSPKTSGFPPFLPKLPYPTSTVLTSTHLSPYVACIWWARTQ